MKGKERESELEKKAVRGRGLQLQRPLQILGFSSAVVPMCTLDNLGEDHGGMGADDVSAALSPIPLISGASSPHTTMLHFPVLTGQGTYCLEEEGSGMVLRTKKFLFSELPLLFSLLKTHKSCSCQTTLTTQALYMEVIPAPFSPPGPLIAFTLKPHMECPETQVCRKASSTRGLRSLTAASSLFLS